LQNKDEVSSRKPNPIARFLRAVIRRNQPRLYPPKWWSREEQSLWFEFVLRDHRRKPVTGPYSQEEPAKRTATGPAERIIENNLGPLHQLYDMEGCWDHKPRTFYIRPRNSNYRWVPVGVLCLNCEQVDWGIPLALSELPELEVSRNAGR